MSEEVEYLDDGASEPERWEQPGPCECQPGNDVWHSHYPDGDHRCARGCGCTRWRPSGRPMIQAVRLVRECRSALADAVEDLNRAWARLGALVDMPTDGAEERDVALVVAQARIAEHAIREDDYRREVEAHGR